MDLESAKKVPLNRITHSVRASQAVLQYGVGAMIDFPNQTLMTAAPEYWQEQVVQIHDERLEKVLRVDYFGLPGGQDDPHCREGISYARFPEWYFCPKCRRFQPISDWVSDYKKSATQKRLNSDPDMVKFMQCPKCRQDLVVTRIITACECGHIDDFPWVKWVHCKNMYGGAKPICAHPTLTFKTSASSTEGLEGLTVSCESCGAKATLKGAFDKDALQELDQKHEGKYNFHCTGRHPWKHTKDRCGAYPKVLQRGSSSVYFPITVSSLVIPPYSSLITKKIEDSAAFADCKNIIAGYKRNVPKELLPMLIQSTIRDYAKKIAIEETDIIQLIHDIIVGLDQGGTFYVFYDRLQLIQAKEMPKFIGDLDCRLTLYRNCRNTENIAVTSLRPITERKPKVFEGTVKGAPARIHFCDSVQNERERIDSIIDNLAADGYRDVVLLTCKTEATSILSDSVNNGRYRNKYLFTTCRKFKGLEADVVILLDVDKATFEQENVLIFYVGTSRARIKLEITAILSDDDCKEILTSVLNYQGKIRRAKKDFAGALNAIGCLET